jgi:hypothetical protein
MDNYMEGENYFTKPKGEDVDILEEVKWMKMYKPKNR